MPSDHSRDKQRSTFSLLFQGDGDDEGIYEGTLNKHNAHQHIYRSSSELKNVNIKTPYIFDFCVDVFNKSDMMYTGDIWERNEIDELLENAKHLVVNASIVTISMSYGYSGTCDETAWLTEYVVGKFCAWRGYIETTPSQIKATGSDYS